MEEYELSAEEYLESYQNWQDRVVWDNVGDDHAWAIVALTSEVGEIAQMYEKVVRKGNKYTKEEWMSELGDVLWNVSNLCNIHGLKLVDVLEYNVDKIEKRRAEAAKKD